MQLNKHTRGFALADGTRTSIQLEAGTWAAVEHVAGTTGMKWQEWIAGVLATTPATSNRTSVIREAVVTQLLKEQLHAEKEAGAGSVSLLDDHPLVGGGYWRLDDDSLDAELADAEIIHEDDSFEGYTLIAGYRSRYTDPDRQSFICIRNRLRDGLHLLIVHARME